MTAAKEKSNPIAAWLYSHLSRVTSSGRFIPLIDGLRFVAIAAVFFYHLNDYLVHKRGWTADPAVKQSILYQTSNVGGCGVPLFFAISGFILGLPFLEKIEQHRPLGLKSYFLRRFTRLEPPYIINLLLVFLLLIFVRGNNWKDLLAPLVASIGYVHSLIFGEMSRINFVAWSLEVEVQFYILAPLIALCLYSLPKHPRRLIFGGIILGTAIVRSLWLHHLPSRIGLSLLGHYEHFFVGMLLADFFHSEWERSPDKNYAYDIMGVFAWWCVIAVNWFPATRPFLSVATFFAYLCTFHGSILSTLISHPALTAIGGMCYTLYLYHFFIISLLGRVALRFSSGYSYPVQFVILTIITTPIVLTFCSILFLGIEKPFMVWKPFKKLMPREQIDASTETSLHTVPSPSTCNS